MAAYLSENAAVIFWINDHLAEGTKYDEIDLFGDPVVVNFDSDRL